MRFLLRWADYTGPPKAPGWSITMSLRTKEVSKDFLSTSFLALGLLYISSVLEKCSGNDHPLDVFRYCSSTREMINC